MRSRLGGGGSRRPSPEGPEGGPAARAVVLAGEAQQDRDGEGSRRDQELQDPHGCAWHRDDGLRQLEDVSVPRPSTPPQLVDDDSCGQTLPPSRPMNACRGWMSSCWTEPRARGPSPATRLPIRPSQAAYSAAPVVRDPPPMAGRCNGRPRSGRRAREAPAGRVRALPGRIGDPGTRPSRRQPVQLGSRGPFMFKRLVAILALTAAATLAAACNSGASPIPTLSLSTPAGSEMPIASPAGSPSY